MKKSKKPVLDFFLKLFFFLALTFGIHLFILNWLQLSLFDNKILLTYSVNFVLTVLVFLSLFFLRKKYLNYLGYIFMYGSLFKFAVFFIFFYPDYQNGVSATKPEFLAFFVPYAVCLFIEIIALVNLLNSSEKEE